MRPLTLLLVVTLALAGCAHEPPRCGGRLESINAPAQARTTLDSNGH